MQEPEQPPSHHEGEALVEEFRWVHGLVRNELEAVRALADRVLGGADGDEIRTEIESLGANSPIWALRVNCLHYCRFVHGHHTLEDVAFFPRLRRADPALDPVVDRLEREHHVIAEHLDAIESHAASLAEPGARPSLVEALNDLAGHLLEHLDYEEESIFPTLRGMADWRR